MHKTLWKEYHRAWRITQRLHEERMRDRVIYGSAFWIEDDTGIYNIPPNEIFFDKDGKSWEWRQS